MNPARLILVFGSALAIGAALLAGPPAPFGDSPSTQSTGTTSRPLLEELNRETQSLYQDVSPGIVRVQLPLPSDAMLVPGEDPLDKWGERLDPESRRRLEEIFHRSPAGRYVQVEISPTTRPGETDDNQQHLILMTLSGFSPNSMGVVVDNAGHVMVPHFVDKSAFDQPTPVALADGRLAVASFVGSDRQTDLTVLKLQNVKPAAVKMADARPRAGALVLVISLNPAFNRLAVWPGAEPDFATIAASDGSIAGFTARNRYRSASACMPIVRELIEHGQIRRAVLGVAIEVVGAADPQRKDVPALGNTPALRIKKVLPNSAADHAGLRAGDLILQLAGETVGDPTSFAQAIAKSRGKTEIILFRDGAKTAVQVDLTVE